MKKRTILFVVISLLAFLGLSAASLIIGDMAGKRKQELVALTQEAAQGPKLTDQLKAQDHAVVALRGIFPSLKDAPEILRVIERIAGSANVTTEIHFENEELSQDQAGNGVFAIAITTEGKLSNIIAFIHNLESSRYFVTITSIEGNAPLGLKESSMVTIKGNIYASLE